jgi:PilZ domain
MEKEKRHSRRRPMRYNAWLALGPNRTCTCMLSDISETGARIDVEGAKELPDRFLLLLSQNGAARRPCQVVWRNSRQLGVKFESLLAPADSAASTDGPAAGAENAATEPAERQQAESAGTD